MLLDTIWGALAALGLDLGRMNELVLSISLVLGLPLYLLDFWIDSRIAFSLLGLFFFRWIAVCIGGPTPVLVAPWRGNVLLVAAFILLQSYKSAKSSQKAAKTSEVLGDG